MNGSGSNGSIDFPKITHQTLLKVGGTTAEEGSRIIIDCRINTMMDSKTTGPLDSKGVVLGLRDGHGFGILYDMPDKDFELIRAVLARTPYAWFRVGGILERLSGNTPPVLRFEFATCYPCYDEPQAPEEQVELAPWIGDPGLCQQCGSGEHREVDCEEEEIVAGALICRTCNTGETPHPQFLFNITRRPSTDSKKTTQLDTKNRIASTTLCHRLG